MEPSSPRLSDSRSQRAWADRGNPPPFDTVAKKVDFSNKTLVSLPLRRGLCRAAAPTVQDGSARESHPGTPNWSPLKPPDGPLPARQPEPDWVCVSASPASAALQAPVSAAPRSHPSASIRASHVSLQVQ